MKVPVPVNPSIICTPWSDKLLPNSLFIKYSTLCIIKSTHSCGVYTIPNFSTSLGNAILKNFSYSSSIILCFPCALSIPCALSFTLSWNFFNFSFSSSDISLSKMSIIFCIVCDTGLLFTNS